MSNIISIQPGQPGEGMSYNVHKPLPYPFHIDATTAECVRGRGTAALMDAPEGRPWRLVGFQRRDEQVVVLWFNEFVADPAAAVGLCPVFYGADKFADGRGLFSLRVPITDVTDQRPEAVSA